jgi:hypothetical protein
VICNIVFRSFGGLILAVMMIHAAFSPVLAQDTFPRGSPLRAGVLEGLRPTVQAEIGGSVEFVVSELRVLQDWAYVAAKPQRPGGVPISWDATKFRDAWASDTMSELVLALLRAEGGGWRVVEYAIGPTDVVWEEWLKMHRLPRRLFADR